MDGSFKNQPIYDQKTYRFQKINNDFRSKFEINLKSRFPGIAARKR